MPTIEQLDPVIVAADDDILPVSQSGSTRRVTRSQLLAGTQEQLALAQGLLGRVSPGVGPPQQIAIGNGLTLANGILTGEPKYSPTSLPLTSQVALTDLVPIGQNGEDRAVSLGTLLTPDGLDISGSLASSSSGKLRTMSAWLSDFIAVEAFGAVGDGVTDDTAAFNTAIACGRPILLGSKTYRIDGQWTISQDTVLLGVLGRSTLRRLGQNGGAWINVSAASFICCGVIFDANSLPEDSWGVLISSDCRQTVIERCSFLNATGPSLGCGLTIQARDGLTGPGSSHSITECAFRGNTCHGLWIQAASGATVRGCIAETNGQYGICLDFNDPNFQQIVRQSSVVDCQCRYNSRGISVGNFNETNLEPPRWGLKNPDASDIVISRNQCASNSAYGIAISGSRIQVCQNQILLGLEPSSASGILCNASMSIVSRNSIAGSGQFAIDAGGSADLIVSDNLIEGCSVGINAGGSLRTRICGNSLFGNQRAITLFQVETDGHGQNFGISCADVSISENVLKVRSGAGGVFAFDGIKRLELSKNRFCISSIDVLANLCWLHADPVAVEGNSLTADLTPNPTEAASFVGDSVVVPEVQDFITIDESVRRVDAIVSAHERDMSGVISMVQILSAGSGYSWAEVKVTGNGTGAVGSVYLRDGTVIGVALSSGGINYAPESTFVEIVGDGQAATAQITVGLPRVSNRKLTIRCLGSVTFSSSSASMLTNWTQSDITIPANSEVSWRSTRSGWYAVDFAPVDYLAIENGSVSLQSPLGDVLLRPGPGGRLRVQSLAEPVGFLTCIGRGSPEGMISAPPGSDYRNLDGGIDTTVWVKRIGNDNTGWFAIA